MVALKNLMPGDSDEEGRIRRLLESDAELRAVVQRISSVGVEMFPDAVLSLNTRQHDEWDPPLSLLITVPYSDRQEFRRLDREFISWLANYSGYDPDRLFVMVLPHAVHRQTA